MRIIYLLANTVSLKARSMSAVHWADDSWHVNGCWPLESRIPTAKHIAEFIFRARERGEREREGEIPNIL